MRGVIKKAMGLAVAGGMAMGAMAGGDAASMALVDKGIASIGGEAKLSAAAGYQVEYEVKRNFQGNENTSYGFMIVKGTDHMRTEVEGEFNGNPFLFVQVLAGEKGWSLFGDNSNEMEGQQLVNQKRNLALQVIPTLLTPLKGEKYTVAHEGDAEVAGKGVAKLAVTGPNDLKFELYLDKETGLPAKTVAEVAGFQGDVFTQETFFTEYKDFDGVKKATSVKSPGEGFRAQDQVVKGFKLMETVDDERFKQP